MKNSENKEQGGLWWCVCYVVLWPLMKLVRLRVEGLDNLPQEGGYILGFNHDGLKDPPVIAFALYPRVVHFWAKVELYSIPTLRSMLGWSYTIPVKRGVMDRDAIRAAQAVVKNGGVLGVFLDGTRKKKLKPDSKPREGAAFIALLAGAPLVPGLIKWTRSGLLVRFGPPLAPEGKKDELTANLVDEMNKLRTYD